MANFNFVGTASFSTFQSYLLVNLNLTNLGVGGWVHTPEGAYDAFDRTIGSINYRIITTDSAGNAIEGGFVTSLLMSTAGGGTADFTQLSLSLTANNQFDNGNIVNLWNYVLAGDDQIKVSGQAGDVYGDYFTIAAGKNIVCGNDSILIESVTAATTFFYGDTIFVENGAVVIFGDDIINASNTNVSLQIAGDSYDLADAVYGNDIIYGGSVTDFILGDEYNSNSLQAVGGNDRLFGNSGVDSIWGCGGNDYIDGGAGADIMNGGQGDDTFIVDDSGDSIEEKSDIELGGGDGGYDRVFASVNYTLSANIEALRLTSGALSGTGNALNNAIYGNNSDNTLDGAAGADTMYGLDGNDAFTVDSAADKVIEYDQGGNADSVTSTISYVLAAEVENLTLAGSAIAGTGNILANLITGNALANILDGGVETIAQNDTLNGGLGNDTYFIRSGGDTIGEAAGGGTLDRVKAFVSLTLAADDDIEFLETDNTASTLSRNLTGNAIAQTITGNAGVNILDGGADALKDVLIGGLGNDIYLVRSKIDDVVEGTGQGTLDQVRAAVSFNLDAADQIEFLLTDNTASTLARNLTGNNFNQTILGNAGANILSGLGGNDALNGSLGSDTLNGGLGNDTLNGGLGNDTLTGAAGLDRFIFNTALNATTNKDTITDYSLVEDRIFLENTGAGLFNAIAAGNLLAAAFTANAAGVATTADHRIVYNTTTGDLFYDSNGNGAAGAVKFATISTKVLLNAGDFFVT